MLTWLYVLEAAGEEDAFALARRLGLYDEGLIAFVGYLGFKLL